MVTHRPVPHGEVRWLIRGAFFSSSPSTVMPDKLMKSALNCVMQGNGFHNRA